MLVLKSRLENIINKTLSCFLFGGMIVKKLIALILICIITFFIYHYTRPGLNLVSLGDSLAAGTNAHQTTKFGYSDFVRTYLEEAGLLRSYNKSFAIPAYRSTELLRDIKNNKTKEIDGKTVSIQNVIHDSDILLISIGVNDLFYKLGVKEHGLSLIREDRIYEYIDQVIEDINALYEEINKYARNQVIVIGYYNPLSRYRNNEFTSAITYANKELKKLATKHGFDFIDTYHLFKNNPNFLPNPADIHPGNEGYRAIAKLIIAQIRRNIN